MVRVADALLVASRVSEDTECASGPLAVGIKGVRSALGVRGGIEGARTVLHSAGETKGIIGMPEGIEYDFSKNRAVDPGAAEKHATAGESEEILGLHVSPSSLHNSSNSRGCVAAVACARLPAVPGVSARVCHVSSSSAVSAAVAHARFTPPCMMHTIRGRTRVGLQVPRGGGAPKVGFPVRPKICVLSQRWRQG